MDADAFKQSQQPGQKKPPQRESLSWELVHAESNNKLKGSLRTDRKQLFVLMEQSKQILQVAADDFASPQAA
eukprot:5369192-Lingulodinium_polyedra.AAC.1